MRRMLRPIGRWFVQRLFARNAAAPVATPPPPASIRRPQSRRAPVTLGMSLPPQTIRDMYRLAGLADPSCHCSVVDRPHLAEDHP